MSRTGRGHTSLLPVFLLFFAAHVEAGGLYLQELATPTQATAGAGANAIAVDASTAFHNPAGMTRLPDHEALLGAGFLLGNVRFDSSSGSPFQSGNGGDQGGPGPVLSAHYVHRLADRVRFGTSLVSISGAVLDPQNDWAGRFEVQELSLLTLSALPSLAVRLHEKFSVGVGANVMYGRLRYKLALPPLGNEGQIDFDWIDDLGAGATASFLWEPSERTRIGAVWAQKIKLKLDGDVNLKRAGVSPSSQTDIPLAQLVHASIVHELTPRLWLAGSFRWEEWSAFDTQFVRIAGFRGQIDRDWSDTWGGSLGVRYHLGGRWSVLSGVGYDSNPVSDGHRTADMPIDRQIRVGIGAQYRWREDRTIGASFSYANLGKARIKSETLRGSYDNNQLFSFTVYIAFHRLPWSKRGQLAWLGGS